MSVEFAGAVSASSSLTSITSGSVAGTKNATYVELIASTARESHRIKLRVRALTGKRSSQVMIATGAENFEVDFLQVTIYGNNASAAAVYDLEIPFTIAASTRVSATASSSSTTTAVASVQIELSDDDSLGTSTEITTEGLTGGVDGYQGTDTDAGGFANTKPTGAWDELIASTSHDFDYMIVMIGPSNNNALVAADFLVDIGTGASNSETAVIEDIYYRHDSAENAAGWSAHKIDTISSGTRISTRCQSSTTDASDRIIDVAVVGINITAPSGVGGSQLFAMAY